MLSPTGRKVRLEDGTWKRVDPAPDPERDALRVFKLRGALLATVRSMGASEVERIAAEMTEDEVVFAMFWLRRKREQAAESGRRVER